MSTSDTTEPGLRAGLIEALRETIAVERDVFAAVDPAGREVPAADGGWSAKDHLAHLSAWRQRQADKLTALRDGSDHPESPGLDIDATNARIQAERADWAWERVVSDADSTAVALIAAVAAASAETLADPKVVGSVMGDGPEHDLGHLVHVAIGEGLDSRVTGLAQTTRAMIDRGGWPPGPAAYARYNLACFYALNGRLDEARPLLKQALADQAELRALAPHDDDLIALRDEIASLATG
ncbi:MAG: hypothetical protein QOJ75_2311 [Chloroflexota bacterium]|jgi:hypothetical protein|nr:hypothetical protein [Chloroflexota bacterium]